MDICQILHTGYIFKVDDSVLFWETAVAATADYTTTFF